MTLFEVLLAQLTDPFRIGLLIALMLTAANTAQTVGRTVPLLLGLAFVAVLIPTAFVKDQPGIVTAIAVGLVSNAIILGVLLLAQQALSKFRSG